MSGREEDSDSLEGFKARILMEEARAGYKKVDSLLAKTKERALLLLSAEVVVLTFLVGGIVLSDLEGFVAKVFACIGCFGILGSIFMLIYVASTISSWPTPLGDVEREKVKNAKNKTEVMNIVGEDYAAATEVAYGIVEKRIKVFGISLIVFVVCATILFTINIFK